MTQSFAGYWVNSGVPALIKYPMVTFFNTAGVEQIRTNLHRGRYHGYWTSMPLASHTKNYAALPAACDRVKKEK